MLRNIITLIIILLIITGGTISAQNKYFGGLAGVNFAVMEIETDEVKNVDINTVFGIGAIIGFPVFMNAHIQLEPKYLQKGGLIELSENGIDIESESGYFELPALLRFPVGNKFHVLAGPTLGFLLSSEMESEVEGVNYKADLKDKLKNLDFGLTVGAGMRFPVLLGELLIDGRYRYGISNISKDSDVKFKSGSNILNLTIEEDDKTFNRGFKLMLGYTIPLGF
jgi:hypothetical protein